jgi:predicted ATPase
MITGFAVKNFKSLAEIPSEGLIPFQPLNVLIGPNGCGKSSILQAIDFLKAFFRSSVEVYLQEKGWDFRDLPNLRQARTAIRWEIAADLDADEHGYGAGKYRYIVEWQPQKRLEVSDEVLSFVPRENPGQEPVELIKKDETGFRMKRSNRADLAKLSMYSLPASVMSTLDDQHHRSIYPEVLRFRDWVERFRSFLIWDPKILRNPDRGKHDEMGPSGEHLAVVLGRLRDKNPHGFSRLIQRLKGLFPTLTNISISGRGGWGWRSIKLHEGNGKEIVFNSAQMSDGVLRLLAIASMLYLDRIPTVLMLEEPENGIHPQIVREVIQILRELTLRKPPHVCQVFLTTHSPYVLDEFFDHPEQVFCMDRRGPQAGATIVQLSQNKQIDLVREKFALGEAWSIGLIGATAGLGRQ